MLALSCPEPQEECRQSAPIIESQTERGTGTGNIKAVASIPHRTEFWQGVLLASHACLSAVASLSKHDLSARLCTCCPMTCFLFILKVQSPLPAELAFQCMTGHWARWRHNSLLHPWGRSWTVCPRSGCRLLPRWTTMNYRCSAEKHKGLTTGAVRTSPHHPWKQ